MASKGGERDEAMTTTKKEIVPTDQLIEKLREEVNFHMRSDEMNFIHPYERNYIHLDAAVSVAVEMVRREREQATAMVTAHYNQTIAAEKRVEAAERLARREHPDDCSIMESAYLSEVKAREAAEKERDEWAARALDKDAEAAKVAVQGADADHEWRRSMEAYGYDSVAKVFDMIAAARLAGRRDGLEIAAAAVHVVAGMPSAFEDAIHVEIARLRKEAEREPR